MSWTKRQFISAAFEEIGLANYIFDIETEGYDFFRNFLSQLGRIKAYITDLDGNQFSNITSFKIWSIGMSLTGIIFCIYYFC